MPWHPSGRGGKINLCQLKGSAEGERLLVFGVTPYWDQLREPLFLMSDLEPVRGAPTPKDHVQCLYTDHLWYRKDFTKNIFWFANSKNFKT